MLVRRVVLGLVLATSVVGGVGSAVASSSGGDVKVSVGSPSSTFPRNKQNEPALGAGVAAADAGHPAVMAAGSNDEVDLQPCPRRTPPPTATRCPFTRGVGVSGIYFSLDGGRTWTQPTYRGFMARSGTPRLGPIGTLPFYYEKGLVSDGDPSLAFGPRPGPGGFSWKNGSRLYYANLTSNFPGRHTFNAFEAIAVSRTDDAQAAAAGDQGAWKPPVIASRQLRANIFSDKDNIWADNASSSRFFGNVYTCWTQFRGTSATAVQPIVISRSSDGGDTWSNPLAVSPAVPTTPQTGVQGCTIRTDSRGTVYMFWFNSTSVRLGSQMMARSFDGGRTFTPGRAVAPFVEVGAIDPIQGDFTFDGVAGARTWSAPSVDIANGAPTGRDASNTIALAWSDGRRGLNHEQALVELSTDRGATWSNPIDGAQAGDRPDFPAVAISPTGQRVYLVYDAFLTPWQHTIQRPRLVQGVLRAANVAGGRHLTSWKTLHRGDVGDARASSANSLTSEFLGDYNYVVATHSSALAVWNDVRNAQVCSAVDRYRESLLTSTPLPGPSPLTQCPATFGNTDIYATTVPNHTP